MSLNIYRLTIFWPQGDIESYVGVKLPSPTEYPVGCWAYDHSNSWAGCGWIQLVQYTMPNRIAWEMYTKDAVELKEVTAMMKMTALVMS